MLALDTRLSVNDHTFLQLSRPSCALPYRARCVLGYASPVVSQPSVCRSSVGPLPRAGTPPAEVGEALQCAHERGSLPLWARRTDGAIN
jgi:hypothetical protein